MLQRDSPLLIVVIIRDLLRLFGLKLKELFSDLTTTYLNFYDT